MWCAALAELDRVLEKCGSDKHHILQMQVWVDELSYVPAMNAVRRGVRGGFEFFKCKKKR